MKRDQEEKSLGQKVLSRVAVYGLLAAMMFWGMAYWNASTFPSEPPMQEKTTTYRQVFNFVPAWPFYYKYYLYKPDNYDPHRQYPLLLLLHGQSRHMKGGATYLTSGAQYTHPAFIVVPIAPAEMIWGSMRHNEPEALPLALDAIRDVQKKYSIDPKRIYVSGYSMGGTGTFAMVQNYPDVFAAAMPLCGAWPTEQANNFPADVPIFAIHGSKDGPEASRNIVNALKSAGKTAFYSEYPNIGHNVWDYVYTDIRIWNWLFSQKRK